MKPNDTFIYHAAPLPSYDHASLSRLYQPIIGLEGLALYGYLLAFYDYGRGKHQFSEILNYLDLGMPRFESALALLTAMKLVTFFQNHDGYEIKLAQPLDQETFLANAAFRSLLEKKVGEVTVKSLEIPNPAASRDISKSFSEVFNDSGERVAIPVIKSTTLDFEHFEQLMMQKGYRFNPESEQDDKIALYRLAESSKLNWYDLFQIAEQTAMQHIISPKRMAAKLAPQKSESTLATLSKEERVIADFAKRYNSFEALAICRRKYNGYRRDEGEENVIRQLRSDGFLDEVINVLLYYTFSKIKSANLNSKYLHKLANDFTKVTSAEEAITKLREAGQKKSATGNKGTPKTNVPEWSNPDYKNQTSQDDKQKLEEMKRQLLSRLRKD